MKANSHNRLESSHLPDQSERPVIPNPRIPGVIGGAALRQGLLANQPEAAIRPIRLSFINESRAFLDKGRPFALNRHRPLISNAYLSRQLGTQTSLAMRAVVELPLWEGYLEEYDKHAERIYCFERPIPADTQSGLAEYTYHVMGGQELAQFAGDVRAGVHEDEALKSAPWLDAGGGVLIGRRGWLPGVGIHTDALDSDLDLGRRFARTSRQQTLLTVAATGALQISDANSYNGTTVLYGQLDSQPTLC